MKEGQGRFNVEKDSRIRSGLEMLRELNLPSEIKGEKVLAYGQAAYDAGSISRSSWKMGFLYLTGTSLIFTQGLNTLLRVRLDLLSGLKIVSRNWVPGKSVDQLRLTKKLDGQESVFHLSVNEPEEWAKTIRKTKKG
jgi:hypothetical protein